VVVDSWRVTGTLALSQPSQPITIQDTASFDFATQYGGWIIEEQHDVSQGVAGVTDVSGTHTIARIGGLVPQPLPKGVE
jgi:hypothetical protein